jgi:TAG lipase / steryl ester hydrolase / phospholipase A2 / LPA acyltransferase
MTRKLAEQRRKDLYQAGDYRSWREIALELDRLEGADVWKLDDTSEDYDHLLIKERLFELRRLRQAGDARQLAFDLYEGLHGNLGNISSPMLYGVCRVGTKKLIEDYVAEVTRCLDFICAGDFADFGFEDKIQFFKRTAIAFGRSALMLSGGGTLGMFHLGVIKALHAENLLPRVISGSSAGSIIAGTVGTRTDSEIDALFEPGGLNLDAFQSLGLRQALKGGAMMDGAQLERCLAMNIGDQSFVEAFDHSRRIVCVTVSPAEPHQQGRLLNYLTAPHVILRRAVLASCAVPGVFPPVMLQARNYEGQIVPYMPGKRWVDGTISADLPMLRLARLHNVNHYIVSQTNPHIVPFMAQIDREQQGRRGLAPLAADLVKSGGSGALALARKHLDPYASGRMLGKIDNVVRQRYSGDINLYPRSTPRRIFRTFSNPAPEDIQRYVRSGERATWPKIERIRNQTRISRTFEDCLRLLKSTEYELVQQKRSRPPARRALR